jgi:4-amino-4-deoxy-L-arabinose transferase-like glycosyltransferase
MPRTPTDQSRGQTGGTAADQDVPAPREINRIIIPILFVAAAAALRLFRLGEQSLWNDEMFSFDVAGADLSAIQTKLVTSYHHPPLYFYLLHSSIGMFGRNAWALRFPSAVFGSLTVGLLYVAGKRIFDRPTGTAAAALCLVAPFHLAYSQEGRPYALAGFLCLLSFTSMMSSIREKRSGWSGSYLCHLLASLALLYTHHWGIFVLAGQAGYVFLFANQDRQLRQRFLIQFSVLALLYLPEAVVLREQASSIPATGWFWAEHPSPGEICNVGQAFIGTYFKMASSVFDSPLLMKIVAGAAAAALFAQIVYSSFRRTGEARLQAVVVCSTVALLIPFAISFFRPEIFLWYRYTVIVYPLVCLTAGGFLKGRFRNIALFALALLLLTSAINAVRYYSWSKSNVRQIAGYVDTVTRGDSVRFIIRPQSFAPLLNYYYQGKVTQVDETYLDKPLGEMVDTASAFAYISIDIPSTIRRYMDGHFDKNSERIFPGEAHMGMRVGIYRQKPEEIPEDE